MQASWASIWHPVARSADLVPGHIFHGRLLGQELALWRDGAGAPNAWENRCPHRGVRLTLGLHLGAELRCLYHGLRYASGTGRCTAIPSLGNRELPRQLNVCAKTFPVAERYGFVWVCLEEGVTLAPIEALEGVQSTTLRSVVIGAPPERVADELEHCCFENVVLFVQPADQNKAIVHGAAIGDFDATARRSLLRHHNQQLCTLRDAIEAARLPGPERAHELLEEAT